MFIVLIISVLFQNISVEVREQGACALWSLAGHTKTQEKYIAEITGITHIHQMLLEPTEKLLTVGKTSYVGLELSKVFLFPSEKGGGVVGWCEGAVYLTSLGHPADTGLQLGKACYPCSG